MDAKPITLDEAKRRYPPIWCIYDHPKDYPRWYVVVRWYGEVRDPQVVLRANLEQARKAVWVSGGQVKLSRMPGDDSKIVECWI